MKRNLFLLDGTRVNNLLDIPADAKVLIASDKEKYVGIEFEDVKYWFQIMWKGKLEYEWLKSVQMEEFGTSKIDRGRPIKFFEPTVEMVVMDYYSNLDLGDDIEIVNDNGEEDCKIIKKY